MGTVWRVEGEMVSQDVASRLISTAFGRGRTSWSDPDGKREWTDEPRTG